MQVRNVLHAARLKYGMQKNTQKNRDLRTITPFCRASSSQLRHVSTIEKKLVKRQYILHMSSQYGKLRHTNSWDRLVSLRHPSKFQLVSHLGFITAATSLNGRQPNFALCLAGSWAGTLYINFGGSCRLMEFCQVQIHFACKSCVLLYCQHYCMALKQWESAPNFAAWYKQRMELWNFCCLSFSTEGATYIPRAVITLGIGPHSS